jgi:transposase
MHARRYELTDFEWSIIAPLLPDKPRGVPRADDRKVLNGVYWRLHTGSPWADIPERYGSDVLRQTLADRGAWANVKPMPARVNVPVFSPHLYRLRNLVERFFNKLKHFRAIATRFEKHDANYLALAKLAAARTWMRFMSGDLKGVLQPVPSYPSLRFIKNRSMRAMVSLALHLQ